MERERWNKLQKNKKRCLCKLILLGMLIVIENGISLSKGKFEVIKRC